MSMNATVRRAAENAVLCWLATADETGAPNVSPKEVFATLGDDRIVIANIASDRSAANVAVNPRVCISFVDLFRQRGFKLEGRAALMGAGDAGYDAALAPLEEATGGLFPIRDVFVVTVEKVSPIMAPSYALHPEQSETEKMESAYAAYGVRPVEG